MGLEAQLGPMLSRTQGQALFLPWGHTTRGRLCSRPLEPGASISQLVLYVSQ